MTHRKQQVPSQLWRVPIYLPYLQPKLTARAIARAEAKLGVRLPKVYLEALRIQNGGLVRLNRVPKGEGPLPFISGIGPRFPSILERDWEQGARRPSQIEALIPFCGDGHYYYCFDYRRSGPDEEPQLTYIDVECFDVDKVVAPDFGTFLHRLQPNGQEEAIGIAAEDKMDTVAKALFRATGLRFEDQGDQDYGYQVFRARLPGKAGWVWLAPNKTRRGFVRRADRHYSSLHKLYPETVLRYPDHSDCGYFVTCSDWESSAAKAMVGKLARHGLGYRWVKQFEL